MASLSRSSDKQFSDGEDENHDVQIGIRTDNADNASADMPGIADLLISTD